VESEPERSLIHPAATGPTACPMAKRLVATASELPQAALGRLVLTKPVAADGTMKTLEPTSAADSHAPAMLGTIKGSAAPAASTIMDAAMGRPSRRPLKTRAQISGASSVMMPSRLHMIEVAAAIDSVCIWLWRSQATMKVM